jgi:hypothetical protein
MYEYNKPDLQGAEAAMSNALAGGKWQGSLTLKTEMAFNSGPV